MTKCGESGIETGVPGYIMDGDPALEYSKECECRSGGVWQDTVSDHSSTLLDQKKERRSLTFEIRGTRGMKLDESRLSELIIKIRNIYIWI
jgi:hypothetical protein